MKLGNMLRLLPALCCALLIAKSASAQTTTTQTTPSTPSGVATGADRLFLAFAEDAVFANKQWWEGQIEFADGDPVDLTLARLQVALQPIKALEVGGRVGFGQTDGPSGFPDGSGATDLDVWGKWNFGTMGGDTAFTAGALVTIPTGDDTAGLGTDAFNLELFGALRHRLENMTIAGHLGFRVNDDGQIGGFELDGKTSGILGGAVLFPLGTNLTAVGEVNYETERFKGVDDDARVLAGIDWAVTPNGVVRGAIAGGLTDGAPNLQVILGYAGQF